MSLIPIATILVACLCLAYAAPLDETTQKLATKPDVNYRLPSTVKPSNYRIILKPYLNENDSERFTFDGECYIQIQATERTFKIQLHMKKLKISVAQYYREGFNARDLPSASPDNLTDIVVYNLNEELVPGIKYTLYFKYVGSMDEDMHGFYRSNYTTSNNVTKWLGSTQFQINHARRAFPSFDEPKFKATFDLSITRHRSLKSAGPTRLIAVQPAGDYVTDVYAQTPKMSTYLLAFIVSELNDRSDGDFGVLARPEYYSQTQYSFDVGKPLLKALDNYLGIPYYSMGNDKLQLAAIPDFSAGAMENWGLVIFREVALLFDKDHSSLKSKQIIAAIVAHELSHMWFGNLVTCDWWSYTWLNEGFGRYFQYHGADMVESYFDMPKQFVVDQVQTAMGIDATNATNPMTNENTNTPAELSRMFNIISYNKGATFIRMTKQILGEDKFQKSLFDYLSAHKYENTKPNDLFTAWNKYWPADYVKYADSYFKSFTEQVGYPLVKFDRTANTTVRITQKRFLLKDLDTANSSLLYTVPITYTTNTQNDFQKTYPKFFLEQGKEYLLKIDAEEKWIIGNIQETGYYRVTYDSETWKNIQKALSAANWSGIHESNRAQIVDDVLNLARAGENTYDLAFATIDYLKTETNYLPWTSAFNGLYYLQIRLGTDSRDFARYIHKISEKAYNKLGFEESHNDTALDIYTRTKILTWSCKLGNEDCISKAKSYFKENLKSNPVPVNIRSVVYCTAMREGNEKDFEKLYQKYKTESVATEETLILTSLGCVKDPKLVSRVFNMILSTDIRRQDKSSVLSSLYSENNENVERVFDLVIENVDQLAEALGGYSAVASTVTSIAARFTTETQLGKLKAFNLQHKNKFGSSVSTLEGAENSVKLNLDWSNARLNEIRRNLQVYGGNSAPVNTISILSLLCVALIAIIFQ